MKFIRRDVIYHGAGNLTLCTGGPHVVLAVHNNAVHCYRPQHVSETLAVVLCPSHILLHPYRFISYLDTTCRDLSQYS